MFGGRDEGPFSYGNGVPDQVDALPLYPHA